MSFLKIEIKDTFTAPLMNKLKAAGPKAAHAVAVQVQKDTEPFVPALTKSLVNRTQVVGGQIIYPGPYARYLYYGVKMVNSKTGKGPMHFIDKMGNEVIMFPKGSKLKPTSVPLHINKSVNPQATSKWFDFSKEKNLDRWVETAERAIERELEK